MHLRPPHPEGCGLMTRLVGIHEVVQNPEATKTSAFALSNLLGDNGTPCSAAWSVGVTIRPVVLFGLLILSTACVTKDMDVARKAVEEFHSSYNASQFGAIYSSMDEEFRKNGTEILVTTHFNGIRLVTGRVVEAKETRIFAEYGIGGKRVTTEYRVVYESGVTSEAFVWRVDGKQAKLSQWGVDLEQIRQQLGVGSQ